MIIQKNAGLGTHKSPWRCPWAKGNLNGRGYCLSSIPMTLAGMSASLLTATVLP